mgnify:CR=1 FL=1
MKTKYKILITPVDDKPYTITLDTDNIEWSMKQYSRNREPFTYEILEEWE